MIEKHNHYRSRKLLDAAEGQDCAMRSPVCRGNPATVVCAHSNLGEDGKGKSIKADDDISVYACAECHHWYDFGHATARFKQSYFDRAFVRTYKQRKRQGMIKLTP